MSIINEALKKTQNQLQTGQQPAPAIPQTMGNNKWLWLVTALVTVGFLGCVMTYVFLIKMQGFPSQPAVKATPPHLSSPPSSLTSRQSSSSPVANPTYTSSLVLNGIMAADGGHLALINNQIYKEGDYIGNKQVLSIAQDKVVIFDKGEIITLMTK